MSRWNPDDIPQRCPECDREYIAYMEDLHDIDLLAARDPESVNRLRREFAEWAEQCLD